MDLPRPAPLLRILTANTGGGHRATAEALAASIAAARPDIDVEILDVCDTAGGIAALVPDWYAWVTARPEVWSTMFRTLDGRRRRHLVWLPFCLAHLQSVRTMLQQGEPDALVVVHPAFTTATSIISARLSDPPAVCTVVTDPVSGHATWYEAQVDLMVVSTEQAAARARQLGVPPSRLQIVDHPVHPRVAALSHTRDALRDAYGWTDEPVVLCTGGGDAMQSLLDVVTRLHAETYAHLVVVCGRNEGLRAALDTLEGVEALGFVDDLPERMAAADVVVTKAGPSTLAEAGAVGTPVVVYGHMPGQEDGNLDWVVQRDWGCVALEGDEVVPAVEGLLSDFDGLAQRRARAQAAADVPGASDRIADLLIERAQEVFDGRQTDDRLQDSLRPRLEVDRAKLRDWSRPTWASGVLPLLGEYGSMLAAVYLALQWPNPITWLLAIVWVGARQHALLVMMHEATHSNLVPNRRVNDLIGEVLLSWPFFISMFAYRKEHWAHHRHVNTERDPDWARTHAAHAEDWHVPLSKPHLFSLLGRDATGLAMVEQLRDIRNNQGAGDEAVQTPLPRWLQPLVLLTAAAVLLLTGWWWVWLVFWVVPALTYLKMALRLRYLGEHFGVNGSDGTRTVLPTWYDRLLLAPHNISYHNEHHLFPGVLTQNLPALHAELQASGGIQHDRWCVTEGYRGVVHEVTT